MSNPKDLHIQHAIANLSVLHLPYEFTLTTTTSKQICQTLPHLQLLDIISTIVEDDAATYIARLPLTDLRAIRTTEDFVRKLCSQDSTLCKTLQMVTISNELAIDCYHLLLNTMKMMKLLLTHPHSKWLKTLQPNGASPQQYNLQVLSLMYPHDDIEDKLEIGVLTCPKMSVICITPNFFTLKMLQSLTKFKQLHTLNVNMHYDWDLKIAEENDTFDRVCLRDVRFDNLINFSLFDPTDCWVSSGYLSEVLAMCPNLKRLSLLRCSGFSNKIAGELADMTAEKSARLTPSDSGHLFRSASPVRKLTRLKIDGCNLLGPSGIEDLLKIDSLQELIVILQIDEMRLQYFDVGALNLMAEKHGLMLLITFEDPSQDALVDNDDGWWWQ